MTPCRARCGGGRARGDGLVERLACPADRVGRHAGGPRRCGGTGAAEGVGDADRTRRGACEQHGQQRDVELKGTRVTLRGQQHVRRVTQEGGGVGGIGGTLPQPSEVGVCRHGRRHEA